MSYIIPVRDLTTERRAEFRKQIYQATITTSLAFALARTQEELTIRDIYPTDFHIADWVTSNSMSQTGFWIDCTNDVQAVISIYRILNLTPEPVVSHIRFEIGNSIVARHQLDSLYAEIPLWKTLAAQLISPEAKEVLTRMVGPQKTLADIACMEGYMSEPVILKPYDRLRVHVTPQAGDTIVLGGFVAERKGTTVV